MIQEANVTSMVWCPPLIKLHQSPRDFPESKGPTICFADPSQIQAIYRGVTRVREGEEPGSVIECTVVKLKTRDYLCVTETEEVVGRLRDSAFGLTPRGGLSVVHGEE